ncbi:hypothetical protein D3C73_661140 [compost metagenome]
MVDSSPLHGTRSFVLAAQGARTFRSCVPDGAPGRAFAQRPTIQPPGVDAAPGADAALDSGYADPRRCCHHDPVFRLS